MFPMRGRRYRWSLQPSRPWRGACTGQRSRTLTAGLLLSLGLAACGATSAGTGQVTGPATASALSLGDRTATATVCVQAASSVASAGSTGVKLASAAITAADAQQQLSAIQANIDSLAGKNASLQIGAKLKDLSTAIANVIKINPQDVGSLQASATALGSAATGVLDACAAAAK